MQNKFKSISYTDPGMYCYAFESKYLVGPNTKDG